MEAISGPVPSISILVVEDEVITLEYLVTNLARKFPAIAFHKALNGSTGLELFTTHTPDIVITDINMPEMGGVQMAGRIHSMKPDTKFIVLTGNSGKPAHQVSSDNGLEFDHYIVKPIFFHDLFAAIEQCIGEIQKNSY
jgi:YesN/AraC family two-component response regulator